jgi:hypothetical protein
MTAPPVLHGVFFQSIYSNRDHVAVFVVRNFRQISQPRPNREIVATGFFPVAALPEGTTGATRARLAEVLGGEPLRERW